MQAGMLWFDNDPKTTLTTKVSKAADYYRKKYGCTPDLCMVNPKMLEGRKHDGGRIAIRPYRHILPGHLWIGVDDSRFKKKPKIN
ncbi:MAG: hypothetical protein L3J16_02800 [Anaerolineales bacterium]|nr:hypothetical protein [Anaerolineales bacterium]